MGGGVLKPLEAFSRFSSLILREMYVLSVFVKMFIYRMGLECLVSAPRGVYMEGGGGRGNVAGSYPYIFKKEIQNEWIKKKQKKVGNISPFLILYIYEIIK